MMKDMKGIDVSKWQGNVDFEKVRAAGYDFVIINAGYGRYIAQKDPYFERNYARAKAAGLGVGAYWYSYALTRSQAEKEAEVFMQAVAGKKFEYPLCFDIEDGSQSKLSSTIIGEMCRAFCGTLERNGYYAVIYSYASFLNNKVPADCKQKYDVWVAAFDVARPPYSGAYGMWQYSEKGRVNGISGKVDLDIAYKDYPAIMRRTGLNGYGKSAKPAEEPAPAETQAVITYTVKPGDTLSAISAMYGTTYQKIAADNGIRNPNLIYGGQKLKIVK